MTRHRPFNELIRTLTPDRRARAAAKAAVLREELRLEEFRKSRTLLESETEQRSGLDEAGMVDLEKRIEMYFNALRQYIEALGGTLEMTARFSDETVVIDT
jgi:hypothetical protein